MAEPWVVLNEDDYPCPVLPPAKAAGSVRDACFAQELQGPEKRRLAEDKSAEQQDAEEVVTGLHHQSMVTGSLSLFVVLLPLVLPLFVYLGVSNPMLEARHGRLVRGILDLDDDTTPPVRDPAHEGRHLRTLDGEFAEEISWMTDNTPDSPPTSANTMDTSPKHKAMKELPKVVWPGDRKGGNVTLGPWPMDENEHLPMKRNLPFKKMKRDGRSTVGFDLALETVGPIVINDAPELSVFTRKRERHDGKTSFTRIPIFRAPHDQ
ncbi:hypothetical protein HPB51_005360 [Rhipicephalus microplus]|uniref:Uncharacterized protein n=1 Tax=Rhipicephalus microplus TaxID=6941 RepID=A0A9J6EYW7_RHIMP|nr:hypothetical protein HPB51_005360 [Rhipicephalus microplus]